METTVPEPDRRDSPVSPNSLNPPELPDSPVSAGDPAAPGVLDPLLRPTREALLARRAHPAPRWKRLLQPGPSGPAAWIRPEADAQAERLGRRTPGTEHVLLALLAVHEVARHEPRPVEEDGAGELLAGLGLDYARAHAALDSGEVTLPADPRSVEAYLADVAGQGADRLLRALLEEDTRARRLVDALRG
ncbi:hypothetical protein [Kitasatospora sp. MY 5-36]|uniref:hypothetical protein n=1 Tax=Kitasatospora sp. MY 5-36 TaxID=1678027 RepID=UPI000A9E2633|nr:hypothetical protein [Kitasatospora sp. MY 5-36]